jgi:hypothetical protein
MIASCALGVGNVVEVASAASVFAAASRSPAVQGTRGSVQSP